MSAFATVWTVSCKEFQDCRRGRWLTIGTILFAVLSIAIVFGSAAVGGTIDFRSLREVLNSLVSLTVFLLPLLAVMIAYDAFVGESESGTLLLMLTYPLSRLQWLAGKAIGQSMALLIALIGGFAVLPILSLCQVLPYSVADLMIGLLPIIASGWLMGVIFLLMAFMVSLLVNSKAQALGVLLLVWMLLVLLYDLALLVLAIAASDSMGREVLNALVIANPASAFRLFNQSLLGVVKQTSEASVYGLLAYLVLWITVLFSADYWLFKRKSI